MAEALRVLQRADRPLSTNEVAERLDVDWHTADSRLDSLVENGPVYRAKVSKRLTLYWDREIPF